MKTIKELNEKTLWRFLKYIYFGSAILLFLVLFILEPLNYGKTDEQQQKMKDQLAFLYSEYEKQNKDLSKFTSDYFYYDCLEVIRKYEYSYKNYERNIYIPSFISIDKEREFNSIYQTFKGLCFPGYYESGKLEDLAKNGYPDGNYFRTYIVDLIWFFATLFILTVFLQRSIYYIFLGSFKPKKETS